MRLPVFLLLAITVEFVGSNQSVQEIKFPVRILQPDLNAISQYFKTVDKSVTAYVHWPTSTTFQIRKFEGYLKIDGVFINHKKLKSSSTYNGFYYKQDKFYVKKKSTGTMKEIHPELRLQYKQPFEVEKTTPYIEIRYASLEELRPKIEAYYDSHKSHFDKVLPTYPATFLVTFPISESNFLEGTFWGKNIEKTKAEERLRVLITDEAHQILLHNTYAHSLVFDQRNRDLIVPTTSKVDTPPFKNVLGVRMESLKFLAEVTNTGVRMFGDKELLRGASAADKEVSLYDIREKMMVVEPRLLDTDDAPTSGKFQVDGQIFMKKINFIGNRIDPGCPFLIEKESNEAILTLESRAIKTICASDDNVWFPVKNT